MSKPLPKHILEALDTFYEDPSRWAKNAWARREDGDKLPRGAIHRATAYSLCFDSGIRVYARRLSTGRFARLKAIWAAHKTIAAVQKQLGTQGGLPSYNDHASCEDVRTVIKKTVAAL